MDEDKIKNSKSAGVSPEDKNSGGSFSQSAKKRTPPPPPPQAGVPPKPPKPPRPPKAAGSASSEKSPKPASPSNPDLNTQPSKSKTKKEEVEQKDKPEGLVDSNLPEKNVQTNPEDNAKLTLEEEVEIAQLQCEDDDNAAAILNRDEVIEKSYKAGLSDQDKQRQKRKLRRLLLLLLLLLLFAGTVSATYFIVKNKTEYVPEFYDNVAIEVDFNLQRSEDRMPGDNLLLIRPIEVLVKADTEEINYDIVALGIRVTAKFTDSGEDCSDIIDVGIYDVNQIYRTDDLEYTGGNYIRCGKDVMLYYKKVLEPGQNEKLINSLRINASTSNEYAKKEITVKVEVLAVYPNPVQIRADNSDFKDAPQGWVEEVYRKMNDIFKERAKNR